VGWRKVVAEAASREAAPEEEALNPPATPNVGAETPATVGSGSGGGRRLRGVASAGSGSAATAAPESKAVPPAIQIRDRMNTGQLEEQQTKWPAPGSKIYSGVAQRAGCWEIGGEVAGTWRQGICLTFNWDRILSFCVQTSSVAGATWEASAGVAPGRRGAQVAAVCRCCRLGPSWPLDSVAMLRHVYAPGASRRGEARRRRRGSGGPGGVSMAVHQGWSSATVDVECKFNMRARAMAGIHHAPRAGTWASLLPAGCGGDAHSGRAALLRRLG
jgi:hypothetical protein